MASNPSPDATREKQSVWMRVLWFGVGAGVSYLLISTPLAYLTKHHPEWPDIMKSGLSVGVGSTFFFFWNYFVNFRTGSSKRDALARYVAAVALLWALQSLALWLFKSIDKQPFVHLLGLNINRDVVATQFSLGGFKFLIYHFWAFPAHKEKD